MCLSVLRTNRKLFIIAAQGKEVISIPVATPERERLVCAVGNLGVCVT